MTEFIQGARAASFILNEEGGHISRENGVAEAGQGKISAGTVVQSGAAFTLSTTGDIASGSPNITGLASVVGLVGGRTYAIAGTGVPANTFFDYDVDDVDTIHLINAAGDPVNATATHAAEAVTITHGSGDLVPWVAGQTPVGILVYNVDTGGDPNGPDPGVDVPVAYIARLAEVNKKQLIFPSGADAEMQTKLAVLNIIVRD